MLLYYVDGNGRSVEYSGMGHLEACQNRPNDHSNTGTKYRRGETGVSRHWQGRCRWLWAMCHSAAMAWQGHKEVFEGVVARFVVRQQSRQASCGIAVVLWWRRNIAAVSRGAGKSRQCCGGRFKDRMNVLAVMGVSGGGTRVRIIDWGPWSRTEGLLVGWKNGWVMTMRCLQVMHTSLPSLMARTMWSGPFTWKTLSHPNTFGWWWTVIDLVFFINRIKPI
jgi:hypothetical protein